DTEGHLWIADTGSSQVLRFNINSGEHIGGLNRNQGIVRPIALACDSAHNLYVTDATTSDVTRYTYFGQRSHALGEIRKLHAPHQAAIDMQGRIYLAESGADRLHVFDMHGNSLVTMDTPMAKLGCFRAPAGVAL